MKSSSENVFATLHQNLQDEIKNAGYAKPTDVQQQCIPLILQGADVCGIAKTGQGKTAAYALPALDNLIQHPQPFHTLVIAPTRELAIQIMEVFLQFGRSSGLLVSTLVGGIDMAKQQIDLARRPHVVIGTPGRIIDHFTNTKGFSLKNLKFLILDECDKLLDMDFERDLDQIMQKINRKRQTLLFTATYSQKIKALKDRTSNATIIQLSNDDGQKTNAELRQLMIVTPLVDKVSILINFLDSFKLQSIIFCNKITDVQKLFYALKHLKYSVAQLHGNMSQEARIISLSQFKKGLCQIMVATDVAARGLDIDEIQCVVNYSIPLIYKEYIHRVGRTARAGHSGISVCLVTQMDIAAFQAIEQQINVKMEKWQFNRDKVNAMRAEVEGALRMADEVMKGRIKEQQL